MKAFTVYQPYAAAIVSGLKSYETRPRRTHIRGRVAVHAGARQSYIERRIPLDLFRAQGVTFPQTDALTYGAVIGTVEIVDCVPVEAIRDRLDTLEKLLGNYAPGRYAWVLANPVQFGTPIPARGRQGWWNWQEEAADA